MLIVIVSLRSVTVSDLKSAHAFGGGGGGGGVCVCVCVCVCMEWVGF